MEIEWSSKMENVGHDEGPMAQNQPKNFGLKMGTPNILTEKNILDYQVLIQLFLAQLILWD